MRAAVAALLAAACVACERGPEPAEREGAALPDRAATDLRARASSEALPEHFGFGRPATPAEIARLDIDVGPDGRGLPPGRGTPAQGAAVYAAKCALCHGPQGEGTPIGVALIGRAGDPFASDPSARGDATKTVGNYWPYATTLFDYVRRSMPFDRPGSLTDEEVYAVSAYLLHRNEIIAQDAVMDAGTLPRVQMPARDRFVRDDRESTNRVR